MTVHDAFVVALVVLAGALVLMGVGLGAVKALRDLATERRAVRARALMPVVLEAMEAGRDPRSIDWGRGGAAGVAIGLLPKLRGADRDQLARLLEQGGVIGGARRDLRHRSSARRQRAAELLGAAGSAPALGALVELLHDRDADVRIAAARALGRIGAPEAAEALVRALADRRVPGNTVSLAILRIGPRCADQLLRSLRSETGSTRGVVAELVGSLGLTQAAGDLEDLLEDHELRPSAARALGRMGLPDSALRLTGALAHELDAPEGPDVRYAVALIGALGQIGHPASRPVLDAALGRTHDLSFPAAIALTAMGPVAVSPVGSRRVAGEVSALSALLARRAVAVAAVAAS